MRVLITGGSGFVGSRLTAQLIDAGCDVTIFDKVSSVSYPDATVIGDVRDLDALKDAVTGHDVVFHLAAEHRDDVRPISLYEEVNVGGAANLVQACEACGCKKVVFTSSVAVYPLNAGEPDEQFEPAPFNPYGATKWKAEKVFAQWADSNPDVALTVVRPCVIFGEKNRGNVYNLLKQIAQKRFLMVGSGKNRKSLAYVGNVVDFLIYCLELPPGKHLFNYADKPDLTSEEIVNIVREELGAASSIGIRLPYSAGLLAGYAFDAMAALTGRRFPISSIRIRKFCADTTVGTSRLEEIGFHRSCTLPDALRRMVRYEFIEGASQGQTFTEGGG